MYKMRRGKKSLLLYIFTALAFLNHPRTLLGLAFSDLHLVLLLFAVLCMICRVHFKNPILDIFSNYDIFEITFPSQYHF